jgi:hypothetical protein
MAKIKVTLIQNAGGVVDRVRIGETEIAVTHGGPAVINGTMGVSLMLENCDVSVEAATPENADTPAPVRASRKG